MQKRTLKRASRYVFNSRNLDTLTHEETLVLLMNSMDAMVRVSAALDNASSDLHCLFLTGSHKRLTRKSRSEKPSAVLQWFPTPEALVFAGPPTVSNALGKAPPEAPPEAPPGSEPSAASLPAQTPPEVSEPPKTALEQLAAGENFPSYLNGIR